MTAYKFRSAEHIDYVFDIIFNNRLYCSDIKYLNDPIEGEFSLIPAILGYVEIDSTQASDIRNKIKDKYKEIESEKQKHKICALSKILPNHLLWGHYASGFRGFAIEVELPDDSENIREVDYRHPPFEFSKSIFSVIDSNQEVLCDIKKAAKEILFSKHYEWDYEKEIRILQEDGWYNLTQPIKRIIVCSERMNESVFKVMKIICAKKDIPLHDLKFCPSELYTKPITSQELRDK
jgi:hypothetical protein